MRRAARLALALATVLVGYAWLAYDLVPDGLRRDASPDASPGAAPVALPLATETTFERPGDPLNVELVGTADAVAGAFAAAGWSVADSITLRSSLHLAEAVVLDRPYARAPVSPLTLWGRRQDLVFERAAGSDPSQRQHVRLWHLPGDATRWLGAATFDRDVGLSRLTGQLTHHIDGDVDGERDALARALTAAGAVAHDTLVAVRPPVPEAVPARNGEGDPYWTDGRRRVLRLRVPPDSLP